MTALINTSNVETVVADYLDHLAALGRSPATINAYRHRLDTLLAYTSENSLDITDLTRRDVEAIGTRLTSLPIAPSSRASFATATRAFLKWCDHYASPAANSPK